MRGHHPQLDVRQHRLQLERRQLVAEDLDEVAEDAGGVEAAQQEGVELGEVLGGDRPATELGSNCKTKSSCIH